MRDQERRDVGAGRACHRGEAVRHRPCKGEGGEGWQCSYGPIQYRIRGVGLVEERGHDRSIEYIVLQLKRKVDCWV